MLICRQSDLADSTPAGSASARIVRVRFRAFIVTPEAGAAGRTNAASMRMMALSLGLWRGSGLGRLRLGKLGRDAVCLLCRTCFVRAARRHSIRGRALFLCFDRCPLGFFRFDRSGFGLLRRGGLLICRLVPFDETEAENRENEISRGGHTDRHTAARRRLFPHLRFSLM